MGVRIDKYIWSVRLVKTRSKATELVKKGNVKLDGENVKPAKEVQLGSIIQISKANALFEYRILNLLSNRIGAKLVPEYITEITKPEELEKYKTHQVAQQAYRNHGTGKPTKKERRAIDDFLDWDSD